MKDNLKDFLRLIGTVAGAAILLVGLAIITILSPKK